MRCPKCRHVQKYREGTRCKKCNYQFVFRKSADGISDFALRQIIQRLSDNDQQAFTATQLALAICRSWRQKKGALIGCGVVTLAVAILIGLAQHASLGFAVFAILLCRLRDLVDTPHLRLVEKRPYSLPQSAQAG